MKKGSSTMSEYYETNVQIASVFGVNRRTVGEWIKKPDFPTKTKRGWSKEKVHAWVSSWNETKQDRSPKDEKTQLECDRLRVLIDRAKEELAQAKMETKRQEAKLHDVAECEREWVRAGQLLAAAVENFRQLQRAKHPKHADLVNDLCDLFLEQVRASCGDNNEITGADASGASES
jgi:phage terminase Nu1 subunit (DNA packaging protein)